MKARSLALLLVILPTALAAQSTYDPTRDPQADAEASMKEAQQRHVNILIDVGGDWCPDCRQLDAFLKTNPALQKTLKDKFVFLKVYVGDERDNTKFLNQLPSFNWVPYFFVVSPDGKILAAMDTRNLTANKQFNTKKVEAFLKRWSRQ